MDNREALKKFLDRVEAKLRKARSTDGGVDLVRRPTEFVLEGEEFTMYPTHDGVRGEIGITFWLGVNERRLFFISYIQRSAADCKEAFRFCFGGACKVGWEFSYEPLKRDIMDGCSVWGTCMADGALVDNACELTSDGLFWATDIAMMAQSMLRTAEREAIVCMDLPPEPL